MKKVVDSVLNPVEHQTIKPIVFWQDGAPSYFVVEQKHTKFFLWILQEILG